MVTSNTLTPGAAGLVFLFDCTDKDSFQALEEWIEKTEGFLDVKGLVGVITATKSDLEREISEEEAKNYARLKKLVGSKPHADIFQHFCQNR